VAWKLGRVAAPLDPVTLHLGGISPAMTISIKKSKKISKLLRVRIRNPSADPAPARAFDGMGIRLLASARAPERSAPIVVRRQILLSFASDPHSSGPATRSNAFRGEMMTAGHRAVAQQTCTRFAKSLLAGIVSKPCCWAAR
jgi:hypothetical protein